MALMSCPRGPNTLASAQEEGCAEAAKFQWILLSRIIRTVYAHTVHAMLIKQS
jgi:hypothetical protein